MSVWLLLSSFLRFGLQDVDAESIEEAAGEGGGGEERPRQRRQQRTINDHRTRESDVVPISQLEVRFLKGSATSARKHLP